jgi:hypothetical protein
MSWLPTFPSPVVPFNTKGSIQKKIVGIFYKEYYPTLAHKIKNITPVGKAIANQTTSFSLDQIRQYTLRLSDWPQP